LKRQMFFLLARGSASARSPMQRRRNLEKSAVPTLLVMGWSGRAPALPAADAGLGCITRSTPMPKTASVQVAVVGIDIGKNSFHVAGHDKLGSIVLRQKWSRGQIEARLANLPPCLIGMEACVGAHHLARKLAAFGLVQY